MKPIRLIMSAWGPYPKEETIDFEALDDGRIFLITGPTGSGKTTIFDAITYAIYGCVSGRTREKTSVRSDFAAEDTDTYVRLEFLHKGKTYIVTRSPKYERRKKRGEGTITQQETAELLEEDRPPLTVLREVNQRLIDIMGFKYDQYKQIAMIAQGEFMELLLANSRERVEIFRNLFKTGMYERIQKKLSETAKRKYIEIQEIRHRMSEAVSMIEAGEDENLLLLLSAEYPSYEKILTALEANMEIEQEKVRQITASLVEKEKTISELSLKGQAYFDIVKRMESAVKEKESIGKKIEAKQQSLARVKQDKELLEKRLEEETRQIRDMLLSMKEKKEELKKELTQYNGIEKDEAKLAVAEEKCRVTREGLERLTKKQKEIKRQQDNLSLAQQQYESAAEETKRIQRTYEDKEEAYRAATIGLVARLVKEGEPCPVCGSMDHPHIAGLSDEVPDEKEVSAWKNKWQHAQKKLEEIYQNATREKGILDAMDKECKEAFKQLRVKPENLSEKCNKLLEEERELAVQKKAIASRKAERKAMSDSLEKMDKDTEKLQTKQTKGQEEASQRRMTMLNRESKEKTELAAFQALETEKEDTYNKLSKEEERLSAVLQVDQLKEDLKSEEEAKKQLSKEKDHLVLAYRMNRNVRDSLREKIDTLREKEAVYSIYSNLDNVTKGNNKDRVVFEHYVLAAYFEDVLTAANMRLSEMSCGRYELMKVKKVQDARTTDSLELEVLDNYTGKTRSVKTLSGGEAFKAALSMALGLSDIVQNNAGGIKVDTMFIDEGFGSLDEESLDQAITSLMKLAGTNQMIGIISHVNELKERIEKQIVVQKETNGSRVLPI